MGKSEPLRTNNEIQLIKDYFLSQHRVRDYTLFTIGINTALRISDLLNMCWKDVFDFRKGDFFRHIVIIEQKTNKKNIILMNSCVYEALNLLKENLSCIKASDYIFQSKVGTNKPIHRSWAYRIIREAAEANYIEGIICCHSMRKTFGYHAWKSGFPPALIMDIYNHSSIEITKKYLSITQDDKDLVFNKNML